MKENVGRIDQAARLVIGPALLLLGYARFGGRECRPLGLLPMVAGLSLIETAITRVCPLNAVLGLDTRSAEEKRRDDRFDLEKDLTALASLQRRMATLERIEPQL